VALLLPLGASGEPARIATAMKQAAEQALIDAGNAGITLITKDTGGNAQGAQMAAEAAIAEGAELILGPLLANEVQAVAPAARERGVPVIAFSSVSATATPGVYLMSFLPEEEVANLVRHATTAGIRSYAALIPKSQYGSIAERALMVATKNYGSAVPFVERYARTPDGVADPAKKLVTEMNGGDKIQALVIPEGGSMLGTVASSLAQSGFAPQGVKLMGTGLWDDPVTGRTALIAGGWYAGVAPDLVAQFDKKYQASYGSSPPRIASLAYDAVSLAIAMGRSPPGQRFTAQQITNPEGYQGVNGLFRFRPNGLIERGLSILEVTPNGPKVIAPPPARFAAGY
jgi:ABC-type branched-subunit amino acid transport system substrate-binding protein